jgi:hypothetical protein
MTLEQIIEIVEFIGDGITDDQADRLMGEAKGLSVAEMEILKQNISGPVYTLISMYEGEMGGFSRY